MKYKNESLRVDKIVSIIKLGQQPSKNGPPLPYRHFGGGPNSLLIEGNEALTIYENEIEALFNSNKEIPATYTFTKFETEVCNLLKILKRENRNCQPENIKMLFDQLLAVEIQEYEILNEVWGAQLQESKIQFGDFTIYHFFRSNKELTEKYPELKNTIFTDHLKSNYLIGITIKARHQEKATEKAHEYFATFENAFNYMLADLRHNHQLSILTAPNQSTMDSIVCNKETMGKATKFVGRFSNIDLEHDVFTDSLQGNNLVWSLITKIEKSDVEKRLLNSIEWIGKATIEKEKPKALVQFVFAIEGLLHYNEGGFITPSIVSQLSDWLAFIIEDDMEQRKKISSYFKELYKKRSAIAHGASKIIDEADLHLALQISKLMIISFLTHEPLKNLKTISELNSYMTDLKFK